MDFSRYTLLCQAIAAINLNIDLIAPILAAACSKEHPLRYDQIRSYAPQGQAIRTFQPPVCQQLVQETPQTLIHRNINLQNALATRASKRARCIDEIFHRVYSHFYEFTSIRTSSASVCFRLCTLERNSRLRKTFKRRSCSDNNLAIDPQPCASHSWPK